MGEASGGVYRKKIVWHRTFHNIFRYVLNMGKKTDTCFEKAIFFWIKAWERKYFFVCVFKFVFVFIFIFVFIFVFVSIFVFVFEGKDWHLFWKSNLFCGLRPGRESLSDSRRSNLRSNNNNFRNNISYLLGQSYLHLGHFLDTFLVF